MFVVSYVKCTVNVIFGNSKMNYAELKQLWVCFCKKDTSITYSLLAIMLHLSILMFVYFKTNCNVLV